MKYFSKYLVLLAAALVLVSCTKKPSDYFPMKIGNKWDYNFKITMNGNTQNSTMSYNILSKGPVGTSEYYKFESTFGWMPEGSNKSADYYRESEAGIVIKTPDEKKNDELVVVPAPLEVGKTWEAAYPNGKKKYTVSKFESLAIGDKTYNDCVKIDYEQTGVAGNDAGYYYFAKDVGLVKIFMKTGKDSTSNETEVTLTNFVQGN